MVVFKLILFIDNTERIFYGLLKEPEQTEEVDELAGEAGDETEKPKVCKSFKPISIYFKCLMLIN